MSDDVHWPTTLPPCPVAGKILLRMGVAMAEKTESLAWGRWIPVSERLPEEDERVLVWFGGEVQMAWFNYSANGVAYFVQDTHYNFAPTHWMPLPSSPVVSDAC